MQQGRVQTDADWNEWQAELARRLQAGTLDLLGRAVYPATTPDAFRITASSKGAANSITIGAGRMYVDGLLAENHGLRAAAIWDPALGELSGSPQPPQATGFAAIPYDQQPYYPNPDTSLLTNLPPGGLVAYLDVWTRPVTYLQDQDFVDVAIGIDTTGRLQTVWQVRLMPNSGGWTCQTPDAAISYPAPSAGRLTSGVVSVLPAEPCTLADGSGYTGLENQLYRVEIHDGGAQAKASFKWSRENASVETGVTAITPGTNTSGAATSVLTVLSLGRDQVLGFAPGAWIELTNDAVQLNGEAGEICQIDSIDVASHTITLVAPVVGTGTTSGVFPATPDTHSHTRILRWDQAGTVYQRDLKTVWCDLATTGGLIPVPPAGTTLVLENGVTVAFDLDPAGGGPGAFNVGDYWCFAARTADSSVTPLHKAPPLGPHHHYTKLSMVSFNPVGNPDCRTPWPAPASGDCCGCCTLTVGPGGQYANIQDAITALPPAGGEIQVLAGRYVGTVMLQDRRDVVIRGCGPATRLAAPAATENAAGAAVPASGETAVITVLGSQDIALRAFAVEAADGQVGVLVDAPAPQKQASGLANHDIAIHDLEMVASTRPAIVARSVERLSIEGNRIGMTDVRSAYPAVQIAGQTIQVVRNRLGLRDSVPTGPSTGMISQGKGAKAVTPGGLQVAGPSRDVLVAENRIEGGCGNGISLGGVATLDAKTGRTATLTQVVLPPRDACTTTTGLTIPAADPTTKTSLVASGPLENIRIERNSIGEMGLCGIGPVGFFDTNSHAEMITIDTLKISDNRISRTVLGSLDLPDSDASPFAYGAICLPDVQNLDIRDNAITDFGEAAGAPGACGIFILSGRLLAINRNEILETRPPSARSSESASQSDAARGGIVIAQVTPPPLGDLALQVPVFDGAVPALRIEHNTVKAALGLALEVSGSGAFTITNNSFSASAGRGATMALNVRIINTGLPLELADILGGFANTLAVTTTAGEAAAKELLSFYAGGTVLFTNNLCNLQTLYNDIRGVASVMIVTLDDLLFANNVSRVDSLNHCAEVDAMLFGVTSQTTSNRFQERPTAVQVSAWTYGAVNISVQNVSSHGLTPAGGTVIGTPNFP